MKQEDYILREIEKIGTLLMALVGKISKSKGSTAISIGENMASYREMLDDEIGFDLDHFMQLDKVASEFYLSEFRGMNTRNREYLADLLKEIGEAYAEAGSVYLLRALAMYELCNLEDKTYSIERERKIEEIRLQIRSMKVQTTAVYNTIKMEIYIEEYDEVKIAKLSDIKVVINDVDDAVDLLGNSDYLGASCTILLKEQLNPDFFDLKTGLAGDVLQKFSNYNKRLAIVGDFSNISSKSLHDFMRESNRSKRINFVESMQQAVEILSK